MQKEYQTNFSELYGNRPHYENSRTDKARITFSILQDALDSELGELKALEIGCYKGEISRYLAPYFDQYFAIDIDLNALTIAKQRDNHHNLHFNEQNAEDLNFKNESFDVVICSHVYEHTPHPRRMMEEIHRVLKPGGVCYFAAGNKYIINEPIHRLPFLSWLPKPLAHKYMQIAGKGDHYYETLYSYSQLRQLVGDFTIDDYTLDYIQHPEKYDGKHSWFENGTPISRGVLALLRLGYRLIPTYLWVLRKEG